jgi:pathogenesis-related protein 1
MRFLPGFLLCFISLCVTGCGSDEGGTPSTPPPEVGTPDNTSADSGFARAMISAHNAVRSSATPAPNPVLAPLTWSTAAAEKAKAWVEQCKLEPNPDRGDFGEILVGTTAYAFTTAKMVQIWASESASYDYDKNVCAPGKVCTDYTQIVWKDTTQVGCAMKLCNQNTPFTTVTQWQLWTCYYWPAGNQAGQRPY